MGTDMWAAFRAGTSFTPSAIRSQPIQKGGVEYTEG
jgi:hypothetical protein